MADELKKLLGDGPYPYGESDEKQGIIQIYHAAGAAIIKANTEISMPKDIHAHSSYEFAIAFTGMPPAYAGRKTVYLEKNKLMPFNVDQEHGPSAYVDKCNVLGLMIDPSIFSSIAYYICGKHEVAFQNESIVPDAELLGYISKFIEESSARQAGYEFVTQGLVNLIAVSLLRQLKSNISSKITDCNYQENDGIQRAISFLRENYNREYSLETVARIANLSPYHFIRVFKYTTGKTPYDYLLEIKVERACILLRNKKVSVTEACYLCGFNNLEHFAVVFKRKTGMLPSQYKKIHS